MTKFERILLWAVIGVVVIAGAITLFGKQAGTVAPRVGAGEVHNTQETFDEGIAVDGNEVISGSGVWTGSAGVNSTGNLNIGGNFSIDSNGALRRLTNASATVDIVSLTASSSIATGTITFAGPVMPEYGDQCITGLTSASSTQVAQIAFSTIVASTTGATTTSNAINATGVWSATPRTAGGGATNPGSGTLWVSCLGF